ncbi:MAG: hypothetical protein BWZ02_02821 [Lentisphaerae bacterium ADurb.BinA184]|nr:MAG: hypothetical protein BWZ02_02821 [Lentisphaerae bacterium ADurb.BinA184]
MFSTPIQLRIQPIIEALWKMIGRFEASQSAISLSRLAGMRAGSGWRRRLNSGQSLASFSV